MNVLLEIYVRSRKGEKKGNLLDNPDRLEHTSTNYTVPSEKEPIYLHLSVVFYISLKSQ